jgi:hypothetical protein
MGAARNPVNPPNPYQTPNAPPQPLDFTRPEKCPTVGHLPHAPQSAACISRSRLAVRSNSNDPAPSM